MNRMEEAKFKLQVWERIQKGIASEEDHLLAQKWAEEFERESQTSSYPHELWVRDNVDDCIAAWNDGIFNRNRSSKPYSLLLLFAVSYGMAEIENGGILQFFENGTGGMAPEVAEGLEEMKMGKASRVLYRAIQLFGDTYPREVFSRRLQIHEKALSFEDLTKSFLAAYTEDEFLSKAEKFFRKHNHT